MGKSDDGITPELSQWIERQHIFVATAPLAQDGLINCSPKGMDTFRILGPREVAYLDLTGSGIETVAHARENGRIVFMFCAFEGPPKIVRLHGTSEVYVPGSPQYDSLSGLFESRSNPDGREVPAGRSHRRPRRVQRHRAVERQRRHEQRPAWRGRGDDEVHRHEYGERGQQNTIRGALARSIAHATKSAA